MTGTPPTSRDDLPPAAWVTVAEAAEKSGVGTSTVRQWYRSGRLPTQRADGDRGAFLVPLDAVLALADDADEEGDAITAEVIDLNASYWSAQTEAAREEATTARNELAEARSELQAAHDEVKATEEQLDLVRAQRAEAAEEARQLRERVGATEAELQGLRDAASTRAVAPPDRSTEDTDALRAELAEVREELDGTRADLDRTTRDLERATGQLEVTQRQLTKAEADLAKLREISTAVGSITDNSWLDLPTNSYRSPIRPQGMAAAPTSTAAAGDALSGLLADTQPDSTTESSPVQDPWSAEPEQERVELAYDADAPDQAVTPPPARPHHELGHHDDDLLPQPEKKGRRGRR